MSYLACLLISQSLCLLPNLYLWKGGEQSPQQPCGVSSGSPFPWERSQSARPGSCDCSDLAGPWNSGLPHPQSLVMIPLHYVTNWLSPSSLCQTRSRAPWLCSAHLSTGTQWLQKRLLVGTDLNCEKGRRARCEEKDPSSRLPESLPFKKKNTTANIKP